jgi:hypothetical protein
MKNFIKYFLLFISPIVFFSYFLDIFISTNLKKLNQYAGKEYSTWNDIFDGKINSDLLIYGSSRACQNFDPSMISDSLHISSYNLGIEGHNFFLQYLRHTILLKNNKKPKAIILSVDMFTLQKRKDLYNLEQFLPYMLWNKEIKGGTINYEGFVSMEYEIPLIRYYGQTKTLEKTTRLILGNLSNPVKKIKGFKAKNLFWNSDFDKAKLTMKKYEVKLNYETLLLFERFITECKSQNIKLIFVYSPEYIEGQKFIKNRGEIMSIYSKFSKQYHIPFYDYSKDTISFQKKYFYNTNHLNLIGTELFTARLIDSLRQSNVIKELYN